MSAHGSDDTSQPKKAKRVRLSLACNQCRKRKVRCDAEMPQCKNCRIRGLECITSDPRNPDLVVYRKPPAQAPRAASPSCYGSMPTASPINEARPPQNSDAHPDTATTQRFVHESRSRPNDAATLSSHPIQMTDEIQEGHHGPITVNRIGVRHRRKLMGSSSLQSLAMVLDLCLEKARLPRLSHAFRHGMRHSEEFTIPLQLKLADLPSLSHINSYLSKFDQSLSPVIPVISVAHIREKIYHLADVQEQNMLSAGTPLRVKSNVEPLEIPFLACAYAVLSLGADEVYGGISETGSNLLTAAYSLCCHLTAMPYVASVQALLVMAIALRVRGKDGQAALLLGQAIRIAQSIGLHRNTSRLGIDTPEEQDDMLIGDDLHARTWWTCFALEKIFELETTRPTSAHRIDCDQILPTSANSSFPFYVHLVSLSFVLEQISDTLFRAKRERGSTSVFLHNVLSLDEALMQWYNSVPEHIRPGSLFCDDSEIHLAMFLSHQYHQAVITLHRAALSIPPQEFAAEVERIRLQNPAKSAAWQRVKKGAELCFQSARAILKVDNDAIDMSVSHTLLTVTPSLLACMVLALQIIRHPDSRMVNSDLELLSSETSYIEDRYRAAGQSEEFVSICTLLQTSIGDFVRLSRIRKQQKQIEAEDQHEHGSSICSISDLTPQDIPFDAENLTNPRADLGLYNHFRNLAFEDFWMTFDPLPLETGWATSQADS